MEKAIICDLDGTIALMNGKRSPFEFLKCDQDDPNLPVIDVLDPLVLFCVFLFKARHSPKLPIFTRPESVN